MFVATEPEGLVAVIVVVIVMLVVTLPLITPLSEFNDKPSGKEGLAEKLLTSLDTVGLRDIISFTKYESATS